MLYPILAALTSKDDHKDNYKEIFEKLVKERFDEIKELTNDLTYYFKVNTARKKMYDLSNGIKLFRKIQSGEMKLEQTKKLQNVFQSNLIEILRVRYKSDDQKLTLKNIALLYKSREAVMKLFNDYLSILSET